MDFLQLKFLGRSGKFSSSVLQTELITVAGLGLAALFLYLVNLDGLALRDWDEGTYANVARATLQAPPEAQAWLYPMLEGEPFSDKPPLFCLLITGAYALFGVSEWSSRLPGALLSAVSIPLLYAVGRELFVRRTAAVYSACIYLTMLPVARHGRLAMLDGAALCFFIAMIWCLLRARRHPSWAFGVGIAFGLICLVKGILGLLLLAIVFAFIVLDSPSLLRNGALWVSLLLGSAVVAAWYAVQYFHYGPGVFSYMAGEQNFARVWKGVEDHQGPPWYYLLELLKYNWPYLLFCPQAFWFAWQHRNSSWSKLALLWSGLYLLVVSVMATKLPWYILPIYPAVALVLGAYLAEVFRAPEGRAASVSRLGILGFLTFIGWGGSIYFGAFADAADRDLLPTILALALTMTGALVLAVQKDPRFAVVLFSGSYITLALLFLSSHWNWELAEAYPVKSVAQLVQRSTKPNTRIYTSFPYDRPSLNFYSERTVMPASSAELGQYWKRPVAPFLLVEQGTLANFPAEQVQILGSAQGFTLITRRP